MVDYYSVLEVSKEATSKEIISSYKLLALKNHPDRNPDDENAKVKYSLINEAYQCLIDPAKRKRYDAGEAISDGTLDADDSKTDNTASASDTDSYPSPIPPILGGAAVIAPTTGFGRMFGVVSRALGVIPSPSAIEEAQNQAKMLSKNELESDLENQNAPLAGKINVGSKVEGKVDRSACVFNRLTVSSEDVEKGFFISARSTNRDKFKLFVFNSDAEMMFSVDSTKSRDGKSTRAALYFTEFDTYSYISEPLTEAAGGAVRSGTVDGSISGVGSSTNLFSRLSSFTACRKGAIISGSYLLCIYGDNSFLGKSHFQLFVSRCNNEASEVADLQNFDASLVATKITLSALEEEYQKTKQAYQETLMKMMKIDEKIDALLDQREAAYIGFEFSSIALHVPPPPEAASVAEDTTRTAADEGVPPADDVAVDATTPVSGSPSAPVGKPAAILRGIAEFFESTSAALKGVEKAAVVGFAHTSKETSEVDTYPDNSAKHVSAAGNEAGDSTGQEEGEAAPTSPFQSPLLRRPSLAAVSQTVSAASSSAANAGGWFASKFTTGVSKLKTLVSTAAASSGGASGDAEHEEEASTAAAPISSHDKDGAKNVFHGDHASAGGTTGTGSMGDPLTFPEGKREVGERRVGNYEEGEEGEFQDTKTSAEGVEEDVNDTGPEAI